MPKFKLVQNKVVMGLYDIVKYQIITYCYISRLQVTESDLDCLTVLAISGEYDLTEFCLIATERRIFKSTQAVRNCIVKLEKSNLIIKEGSTKKKKIVLNPSISVQASGNLLINYKFIHVDSAQA